MGYVLDSFAVPLRALSVRLHAQRMRWLSRGLAGSPDVKTGMELFERAHRWLEVVGAIPKDSMLYAAMREIYIDAWVLTFLHHEFHAVPEGGIIPIREVRFVHDADGRECLEIKPGPPSLTSPPEAVGAEVPA